MSNNEDKKMFTEKELYSICSAGEHFYLENIADEKYEKLLNSGFMNEFQNDIKETIKFFENSFENIPKSIDYKDNKGNIDEDTFWEDRQNYINKLSFQIANYLEKYWNGN